MSGPSAVLDARILVVDDLEADARLAEAMLRGAGFTSVTPMTDPRAACDAHREQPFDLVILDILLPGTDGFEVMARLHASDPELPVPVIMVTAEPDHMKRALEAGARDFVGKPIRMAELLSRARNALELGLMLKEQRIRGRMLEKTLDERTADLREAEDRFRALVEQSIAGIYIVEDGRFTYANPRLCEWLGYTLDELQSLPAIELVHEGDRARLIENRRRRAANGSVDGLTDTYRFVRPDGGVVHLSVSGRTLELRGRPVNFGIAQDVTERVRAQELLAEAEKHYRALAEQSIVGICLMDKKRIFYANARLQEMVGFDMHELGELSLRKLIIPEDHYLIDAALTRRRAGEIGSIALTCRVCCKDGRIAHLGVESKIIELAGRKVAIGVVQDITESALAAQKLRDSEEKHRLLLETTTDAVVLLGDDMRILYANSPMVSVFGYAPAEVVGRDISVLQPERLREPHRRAMQAYLATGVRTLDWRATETTGLHRDGHEFPVEISFSNVAIGGKSIFAGFMRDITQRKSAHAALESANRRLRTLSERVLAIQEEERRHISRELHDDVGQSLLALNIGLHRLEAHVEPAHLALLSECIDVTSVVQEQLRELSVQLHPPHLDQLGLQDALRWLVNRQGQMTGLEIECRFNGAEALRLPPTVEAACYRICQEALNNATRHAKAQRVVVELRATSVALEIAIGDDGVGFDAAAQREALLTSGALGLIGMEERARLAGGRLELQTAPGSGTRVTAWFPIDARKAESARSRERV